MTTGIYLRVKRGDVHDNVDIAELTQIEIENALSSRGRDELIRWIVALAGCCKDISDARDHIEQGAYAMMGAMVKKLGGEVLLTPEDIVAATEARLDNFEAEDGGRIFRLDTSEQDAAPSGSG